MSTKDDNNDSTCKTIFSKKWTFALTKEKTSKKYRKFKRQKINLYEEVIFSKKYGNFSMALRRV